MNVLHLSDLHFSHRDSAQSNLLVSPLLADVERISGSYYKPEILVFSGDIVSNPDEPDVYYRAFDYIEKILAKCGLSERDLVLVPGNHDVSRTTLRADEVAYQALKVHRLDQDYIEHLYAESKLHSYVYDISRGFFELAELVGQTWRDPFINMIQPREGVAIIALNSSFCCSLEGSSHDHGRLAFPLGAWEKSELTIANDPVVFTTMHHPIGHLTEPSARLLAPKLGKHSAAHFFGHLHAPTPTLATTPQGKTLYLQSGALYARKESFKGYCVLSIDGKELFKRVQYRTYQDARGEFDEGINVCRGGVFFPSQEDDEFWNKLRPSYSEQEFRQWLKGSALEVIEGELDKTFSGRRLTDTHTYSRPCPKRNLVPMKR